MRPKPLSPHTLFAWLFLTTGIFAVAGSLFSWGEGWLFSQSQLSRVLLPWGDLILTGPLSLLSAYAVGSKRAWGIYTGLLTSGMYLFGSVLVFISLIWAGKPYPLRLIIPPIAGVSIAVSLFIWVMRGRRDTRA
ncbi:MAG: hypothetical protein EAZ89_15555 [Bacteroidetes bacterium]|nr:MAG: hypothetical protein EAZ89_15555 [Bacteroidota bacterium]